MSLEKIYKRLELNKEKKIMDYFNTKELLLGISIFLAGYGVKIIDSNTLLGIGLLLVAAGLFILRAYLKKKGWELAGRVEKHNRDN